MIKVIAGDIGGTKTRLATVEVEGTRVRVEREISYPSRDFDTFEALLAEFLKGVQAPAPCRIRYRRTGTWRCGTHDQFALVYRSRRLAAALRFQDLLLAQ